MSVSLFPRVNGALVDAHTAQTNSLYADPSLFAGSTNASAVVPYLGSVAQYGQLWRGMPVFINTVTGKLVPPNDAGVAGSTSVYTGVLHDDITTWTIARGVKITYIQRGRVRSYAGGALTVGDWVKPDTSANFSGFVKWADGVDDVKDRVGQFLPLDDGSALSGATAGTTAVQGDTIFVNLV
jgi:hypothetical protein